jgi:enamine deaminase RidA (YjgF/YER057c/UK114 family)
MAKKSNTAVQHIYPDGLHKNPAFTNVIAVSQPSRTIYIGGQNAVDSTGSIVGKGDLKAQTEQILANIQTALEAAGADIHDVIKFTIFAVQGQDIRPGYELFQKAWGQHPNPPLVSMAFVAALANPDFLMEIEAVAVVAG